MIVRCEPIALWTYGTIGSQRSRFDTPFPTTLDLLDREAGLLGAHEIVLGGAWTPAMLRRDGWPRSGARPEHPGVVVRLLGARHGDIAYPCATFTAWQDNVRAVALALEALRMVGRYGVAKHGEQYRGFRALPGGSSRGAELIAQHGSVRAALMATHPDHGGDPEDFAAVQAARPAPDTGETA